MRVALTRLLFRLVELVAFQRLPSRTNIRSGNYTDDERQALKFIWRAMVRREVGL